MGMKNALDREIAEKLVAIENRLESQLGNQIEQLKQEMEAQATAAIRQLGATLVEGQARPNAPLVPAGPTLDQFAQLERRLEEIAVLVVKNRGAINHFSYLSFSLQGLRRDLNAWVERTKFEISHDLHEDEANTRDDNLRVFNSMTQNQQKVYDAKMDALEKQAVEMRQSFSQSVTQIGQKFTQIVAQFGQKMTL